MSKFNTYARRVDEMARKIFAEYRAAEENLRKTQDKYREYPQRVGPVDVDYAAKSARAMADYQEAQQKFHQVQTGMKSHSDEIDVIREELAAELEAEYCADPAQIDAAMLELLKSGIMKGHEYARFMDNAEAAGNTTMMRIIGKYAEEAAKAVAESDRQLAAQLRRVANRVAQCGGQDTLKQFDYLVFTFKRTMNNPGMIRNWDELTSEVIKEF